MTKYLIDESGVVQFLRRQPMAAPGPRSHEITKPYKATKCAQCAAVMAQRKLFTHLVIAHGLTHAMAERISAGQSGAPEPSHAGSQTGRLPSAHGGRALTGPGSDSLDGGRGLAHFARERGRFGSMPSYDDYEQ